MNDTKRYPYNDSRLYIEEMPSSPTRMSRRTLPPVRDATPVLTPLPPPPPMPPMPPPGILVPLVNSQRNSAAFLKYDIGFKQSDLKWIDS